MYSPIKVYDISQWNNLEWYATRGSRLKIIYEDPSTGIRYYFKESLKKPDRHYPCEFWSEIIASKFGQMLGFNMVDYNVGYSPETGLIGCVSADMLKAKQSMMEGFHYLTALNPDFVPDTNRDAHKLYDFQLIELALAEFGNDKFLSQFLDTLIFDSIISNSDRHQENWAIIFQNDVLERVQFNIPPPIRAQNEIHQKTSFFEKAVRAGNAVFNWISDKLKPTIEDVKESYSIEELPTFVPLYSEEGPVSTFAPIYDSGSSLGRELSEEKIIALLKDRMQLNGYINKGTSEVHWNKKKIRHFELIKNLAAEYDFIRHRIDQLKECYDVDELKQMIQSSVDSTPSGAEFELFRITPARQEFLFIIIDTRIQQLFRLFST